jgi:uncharacterized coiled-coil DUF342 family protein
MGSTRDELIREARALIEQSQRLVAQHQELVQEYERIKNDIEELETQTGAPSPTPFHNISN